MQKRRQRLPQQRLQRVKGWFLHSETIFLARITALAGFVTAVMGALDWSPLLGLTSFNRQQVIWLGSIMLLQGIGVELARRRRATDLQ